jgi:carbohydrate-selective porin OprB
MPIPVLTGLVCLISDRTTSQGSLFRGLSSGTPIDFTPELRPPPRHQTTAEFTYRTQLTSHWALQSDFQVLYAPTNSTGTRQSATVLGLRSKLIF